MSSSVDWKPLEFHLQTIHKSFINLENNEKRVFTQHFNKVYKYVTESMGEIDDFFTYVFQRQQLAGSYADNIKVGQPNEYDALMLLNFPDPVVTKTRAGFVEINIKDGISQKYRTIDESKYKALIDDEKFLLQDKVLGWLRDLIYTVVKRTNNVITIGRNVYDVKHSSNGPAVTLDITITKSEDNTTGHFSVDFVGAMAFDFQKIWFADFKPPIIRSKNWNAIVKPNKAVPNKNREWTCSYADMEREYLRDTQTLKQLIRIFKKIRDTHKLTNLKSYYIKVIFLHQRKKENNDYWQRSLGTIFSEMFSILLKHLENHDLRSFWHKDYNLFGELTSIQLTDIFNKLKSTKDKIEKNLAGNNPKFILSVILPKIELDQLEKNQSSANGTSTSTATASDVCKSVESKSCTIMKRMHNMPIQKA